MGARAVQAAEDSRNGAIGIQPIRDENDLEAAHAMREHTDETGEPAMIFGVATANPQASKTNEVPWLSENGIASPDGLGLFNLRNAEIS